MGVKLVILEYCRNIPHYIIYSKEKRLTKYARSSFKAFNKMLQAYKAKSRSKIDTHLVGLEVLGVPGEPKCIWDL